MRFVLEENQQNDVDADDGDSPVSSAEPVDLSAPDPSSTKTAEQKTPTLRPSISIASLLAAGKLVKPRPTVKATLQLEKFDLSTKKWLDIGCEDAVVETERFSYGAFRDAFHVTMKSEHWVLKTYQEQTVKQIEESLKTSELDHCHKHVQMHAVASHLAESLRSRAPKGFGSCFAYNECFFTKFNERPATIERFIPGDFVKMVNNDGECVEAESTKYKELFEKAQCLVHFTYEFSDGKLMLTDIQGAGYCLCDPEISSQDVSDGESDELYFCVGNCAGVGIEGFQKSHVCNKFCKLLGLKSLSSS